MALEYYALSGLVKFVAFITMGCAASLIYDALSGLVHDGLRRTMGFVTSLIYYALSGLVFLCCLFNDGLRRIADILRP